MSRTKGFWSAIFVLALSACSSGGWTWQHPQGLDAGQRERDLADCMYYASITDPRAFGADHPVKVQEFDEPVRECMAKRGWIFVEPARRGVEGRGKQHPY